MSNLFPFQTRPDEPNTDSVLKGWLDLIQRRITADSAVITKSASFTPEAEIQWFRVSASGGAVTVTVPRATSYPYRTIGVVKTDTSTNEITLTCSGSDTISGDTSRRLSFQYHRILLKSDGISSWDVINHGGSGVYTPTLFNTTNIDASTAYECQFSAVDKVCTVSGRFDADTTAGAPTATLLGMSLPIPSNFANSYELGGTASPFDINQSAAIIGDTTNDRASVRWLASDTSNRDWRFIFQYRII